MLDGVYRRGQGGPVFVEAPAPSDEGMQSVLHEIVGRILKMLTRRGALVQEQHSIYVADNEVDSDDARRLRPLQAAACIYRIACGARAGQKVLRVQGAMPRERGFEQNLCANINGFSLHAAMSAAPMSESRWNNCAATSRVQRWPMTACSATARDGWCSS